MWHINQSGNMTLGECHHRSLIMWRLYGRTRKCLRLKWTKPFATIWTFMCLQNSILEPNGQWDVWALASWEWWGWGHSSWMLLGLWWKVWLEPFHHMRPQRRWPMREIPLPDTRAVGALVLTSCSSEFGEVNLGCLQMTNAKRTGIRLERRYTND